MTPEWAAALLVERYFGDLTATDRVVEPSCGTGVFLKALPDWVTALGVELDPILAAAARANAGREVLIGDFRTIELPWTPTAIVGNPPFDVRLIEQFLSRAARLLPEDGRCGFLLPAYAMQTHRRAMRWHQTWSMAADLIPRRLFPRLRHPLLFVQFRKQRVRTLVGFVLYSEAVAIDNLSAPAKLVLIAGHPRKGVWRALVEATLQRLGGEASLEALYTAIEPRRPTHNAFWREKVRQVLQLHFEPVRRGVWRLPVALPSASSPG